jgi:hypothetical protein
MGRTHIEDASEEGAVEHNLHTSLNAIKMVKYGRGGCIWHKWNRYEAF